MSPEFEDTKTGEVPKEWKVVSLKEITVNLTGGGTPSTSQPEYWDGDIPWMTSANLTDRNVLRGMRNITKEGLQNSATNIIPKGSLLISTRVGIGKVGIAGIDIAISQDLTGLVLDISKVDVEYLYWAFLNKSSHLGLLSQGSTVKGLTRDYLRNLKLSLPPLPEQKKIAEILSTVDQAIEKVEEAIEKTQKLKKGLMEELLTKGIGHKEFRNSEIGRIPNAWKVMKLGETANVRYGLGQPPALESHGIPMIRATNVKRGKIVREGLIFINPRAVPNSRDAFLRVGDILVVRSGAYTGDVALVTKEWEGAVAGYDLIITPSDTVDSQFLTYYLLSASVQKRHFVGLKVRSAQPHLNSSQVEETPIPLPPLPEQQKIAEILSTVDKRLESLRNRKEKLGRVKKGLMNDLLTGKKRVTSLISEEVPMREIEEIKNELRENMPILRDKYKVKTIGLFGSYIRGEQSRGSDVDILVEFYETIDLFTFIELEEFLSEKVGIKVDLVMKDTLKPRIKDAILREAVTV